MDKEIDINNKATDPDEAHVTEQLSTLAVVKDEPKDQSTLAVVKDEPKDQSDEKSNTAVDDKEERTEIPKITLELEMSDIVAEDARSSAIIEEDDGDDLQIVEDTRISINVSEIMRENLKGESNQKNVDLPSDMKDIEMEIDQSEPIARLTIKGLGYPEDEVENEEDLVVMTVEEIRDFVIDQIKYYFENPEEHPLVQAKREMLSLMKEAQDKRSDILKLRKIYDNMIKDQQKFLRHTGVLPKIEMKSVGVGVDLPWIEPGPKMYHNAEKKPREKKTNLKPKPQSGQIELIDLSDEPDEPPPPKPTAASTAPKTPASQPASTTVNFAAVPPKKPAPQQSTSYNTVNFATIPSKQPASQPSTVFNTMNFATVSPRQSSLQKVPASYSPMNFTTVSPKHPAPQSVSTKAVSTMNFTAIRQKQPAPQPTSVRNVNFAAISPKQSAPQPVSIRAVNFATYSPKYPASQPGSTQINTVNFSAIPLKHPAPLPANSTSVNTSNFSTIPPKPILKVSMEKHGIVLQWDIPQNRNIQLTGYEIYGYQEKPNMIINSDLWKKFGTVAPLELPMSCTLTQFVEGARYHFTIRAISNDILGHFSDAVSITYNPTN